jgi:hypothetical protein
LVGFTDQVVAAAVQADDLALVDLDVRVDEQATAILQVVQRVGQGLALDHRHEHAVAAVTCSASLTGP